MELYINRLEEYCQERGWPPPLYHWTVTSSTLPLSFGCQVKVGSNLNFSSGYESYDTKEAQEFAARKACKELIRKLNHLPCSQTTLMKSSAYNLPSDGGSNTQQLFPLPQTSTVPAAQFPSLPQTSTAPVRQIPPLAQAFTVPGAQFPPFPQPQTSVVPASQFPSLPQASTVPAAQFPSLPQISTVPVRQIPPLPQPQTSAVPGAQFRPLPQPQTSVVPAAQFPSLPQTSTAPAAQFPSLPQTSTVPAAQFPSLPQTSVVPEAQFPSLPQTSTAPAAQFPSLPQTSVVPAAQFPSLPQTSTAPAAQFSSLPQTSTVPAAQFPSLPQTSVVPAAQFPPLPQTSTVPAAQFSPFQQTSVVPAAQFPSLPQTSSVPAAQFPPLPPQYAQHVIQPPPFTFSKLFNGARGKLSKLLPNFEIEQTTVASPSINSAHMDAVNISSEVSVTKRCFGNHGEYVEGKWNGRKLIELRSFQFIHPHEKKTVYGRKQNPGFLFTFDEDDFVARIRFHKLEQVDFGRSLVDIKVNFFKRIELLEIIRDRLLDNRNNAVDELKQLFLQRRGKSVDIMAYAEDLYQISLVLYNQKHLSNKSVLKDIIDNKCISSELINICERLLKKENDFCARSRDLPVFACTLNFPKELEKIYKEGITGHRKILHDKFLLMPSIGSKDHLGSGSESLRNLDDQLVIHVCSKDIMLFSDLREIMSEPPFLDLVNNSWNALFKKVQRIRKCNLKESSKGTNQVTLKKYVPLTHPVYFYLCKSFKEVIDEIITKANVCASDLLIKNRGGFILSDSIDWHSPAPMNDVLLRQYHFLFKQMMFFKPGCYSNKRKSTYNFQVLQKIVDTGSLEQIETNSVDGAKEDRWIWVHMLDDALSGLLSEEQVQLFRPLLEGYTDFVTKTKSECFESFRVFTHNTTRFITLTIPHFSKESTSEIIEKILRRQVDYFKKAISEGEVNNFRVLVDVYSEYWKQKECVITQFPMKFPYEPLKSNMQGISRELVSIVDKMLSKDVKPEVLIECFRSYNDFLQDLDGIDFNWFIKCEGNAHWLTEAQVVNESKRSYKILDSEGFIKRQGVNDLPRHYLIEVVEDLLAVINDSLCQENWPNDSDDKKLKATCDLFSALRKSFHYLREEPDYVSFDEFKKDSTQPFISAVKNTSSCDSFKHRICIVGESFSYLRKQDEIDINKALELYKQMNNTPNSEILENCYDVYQKRFNFYVEETINRSHDDKIRFIVENVQELAEPMSIGVWEENFKRKALPELLAGLAAVWSIQQSTDIASTGKSLKLHCIQILCILRLLSVDKGSADNHLAQVLTGQGKSVILGLLSCLLALMGHKVRLVCYSQYLASRDEQDFKEFFQIFGISDRIIYGSFKEMANEVLKPEVNGKKQGLRELVRDRILNHSKAQNGIINCVDVSNTILLIDEVDVFFTEKFYGNTYNPVCTVEFLALASIQEKLREVIKGNVYNKSSISDMIKKFIRSEVEKRNEDFEEFNNFLLKPEKYKLLKKDGVNISEKEYTNQSLFDEHIDLMIDYGMAVAGGTESDWFINEFKINEDGMIASRGDDEVYYTNSYVGYYNTFIYFRLKKKDFDHKSYKNYGYFFIDCGRVSYARLPEKYALILGVSGTLTDLNEGEKKVLNDSYSIKQISSMPSFFGHSKVTFDMQNEFTCLDSKERWLCEIDTQTNRKINMGRSVLIFFDTSAEINKFKKRFFSKYDRFFVLTEDTEYWLKKKYIDEAGITKTVTLASRSMGRGVDFRSSLTVEKNGGVHVIQTFFSLDIKEETQIKGRTARKDNEGSYQLILCKEHLIKDKLLESSECDVNYTNLNDRRNEKYREITLQNNERVMQAQYEHQVTMDYLESFFNPFLHIFSVD